MKTDGEQRGTSSTITSTAKAPIGNQGGDADPGYFARRATGLVRDIRLRDTVIFNVLPAAPGITIAISLFFILSTFSQVNIFIAMGIALVCSFVVSGAFGLLSQIMPRSGGDYVLVSRSLHPAIGLGSSLLVCFASLLSVGYFAIATAQVVLGPMLTLFGISVDSQWLQDLGADVTTTPWSMIVGIGLVALLTGVMILGTRRIMRLQYVLFLLGMAGLVLGAIILLFTSHGSFIEHFNSFAQPFTNQPDTYHHFIDEAHAGGVTTGGGTDWHNTIIASGAIIAFTSFTWWSVGFAGEIRAGGTRRNWLGMLGGMAITFGSLLVMVLLLYKTVGREFLVATNAVSEDPEVYTLPVAPYWVTFIASINDSPILVGALGLTFLAWGPLLVYVNLVYPVRAIFAWAFDQVIPAKVAATSPKRNTPVTALLIVGILSAGTCVWAAYSTGFYEILGLVVAVLFPVFILVGIAAIVFPYRNRRTYAASASQSSIAGVPLLVLFGIGACAAGVFSLWLFLGHAELGLKNGGTSFADQLFTAPWNGAVSLIACLLILGAVGYGVARWVRAKQGVDLALNYREIPPE